LVKKIKEMEKEKNEKGLLGLILTGTESTLNNAVKALLIGFIVGLIIYYFSDYNYGNPKYPNPRSEEAGLIIFVVVSAGLFLKYNQKK
jgi:ABC-type amino acid transport system permease subunit